MAHRASRSSSRPRDVSRSRTRSRSRSRSRWLSSTVRYFEKMLFAPCNSPTFLQDKKKPTITLLSVCACILR